MITNKNKMDNEGFAKASRSARNLLTEQFEDIERPAERRRLLKKLEKLDKDKKLVTALVKSSDHNIDDSEAPWVAQHAIHQFRRGENDIISAIEKAAMRTPKGRKDTQSKFNSSIGIEYELNVPGIFDFTNDDDNLENCPHENYFVKKQGSSLIEQETGPRTLEIISDVYPSIDMAVDAMMQRELFAEEFVNSNNIPGVPNKEIRRHSRDHRTYHPGIHIHVDPEDYSDPETVESVIKHFAPELSFATANAPGEVKGKEVISTRQAKSLGGGYPKGYAISGNTTELRMPDVPRDKESFKAITSICLGIAKYAETQSFGPNVSYNEQQFRDYFERIAENGKIGSRTVDELLGNMNCEKFNPDTDVLEALSEGPGDEEKYERFVNAVETGLYVTGYDIDRTMDNIERHLDRQWRKVDNLN